MGAENKGFSESSLLDDFLDDLNYPLSTTSLTKTCAVALISCRFYRHFSGHFLMDESSYVGRWHS